MSKEGDKLIINGHGNGQLLHFAECVCDLNGEEFLVRRIHRSSVFHSAEIPCNSETISLWSFHQSRSSKPFYHKILRNVKFSSNSLVKSVNDFLKLETNPIGLKCPTSWPDTGSPVTIPISDDPDGLNWDCESLGFVDCQLKWVRSTDVRTTLKRNWFCHIFLSSWRIALERIGVFVRITCVRNKLTDTEVILVLQQSIQVLPSQILNTTQWFSLYPGCSVLMI